MRSSGHGWARLLISRLIWTVALATLAACSGSGERGDAGDGSVDPTIALARFTADCGALDQTQCNPSVASVIARFDRRQAQSCSAFLVEPDVAFMARHCVPLGARRAGASLAGEMRLQFPKVGDRPAQIVDVLSVADITPIETDNAFYSPDWVAVRLGRAVPRPTIRVNAQGVTQDQRLRMVVFDHDFKTFVATMRTVDCRATLGSMVNPLARAERSPYIAAIDCLIKPGNSGAPILDEAGDARGVLTMLVRMRALADPRLTTLLARMPERSASGTNFACVRAPSVGLVPGPNPDCGEPAASPSMGAVDAFVNQATGESRLREEVAKRLSEFQASQGRAVVYEARARSPGPGPRRATAFGDPAAQPGEIFRETYDFEPKCARLSETANASLYHRSRDWLRLAQLNARRGRADVFVSLSAEGRPSLIVRLRTDDGVMRFSPAEFANARRGRVLFVRAEYAEELRPPADSLWNGSGESRGEYDLDACPD